MRQVGSGQVGAQQFDTGEIRSHQAGAGQVDAGHYRHRGVGVLQEAAGKIGRGTDDAVPGLTRRAAGAQVSAGQEASVEIGFPEKRAAENRLRQVGAGQVRVGEIGAG